MLAVACVAAALAPVAQADRGKKFDIQAHRGGLGLTTESTLHVAANNAGPPRRAHGDPRRAGAELYTDLKPQQASRGLAALHDRGLVARGERQGQWSVIDPLLRRYLASRRMEPLSFAR